MQAKKFLNIQLQEDVNSAQAESKYRIEASFVLVFFFSEGKRLILFSLRNQTFTVQQRFVRLITESSVVFNVYVFNMMKCMNLSELLVYESRLFSSKILLF